MVEEKRMIDPTEVIADLEARRDNIDAAITVLRRLYGIPPTPQPPALNRESLNRESLRGHGSGPATAKVRKAYTRQRLEPGIETPEHQGRPSPVQDAILKVLNPHTPMSSLEILEKVQKGDVKTTAGSVYATVRALLDKGLIARTKNDEGRVAWTLVVKGV